MKKLLTIFVVVAVMGIAANAQVGDIESVNKAFGADSAGLCEHVTGEIVVETSAAGVVITDEMPEGLALLDVTVVGGDYSNLYFDEDGLEVTLDAAAEYTISFEVQVTDVLSYESVSVVNTATATDTSGNADTAADDLELLPYGCFDKSYEGAWLEGGAPVDRYAVPIGTKVYFLMYIDFGNCLEVDMLDAYVKDNLGGDLMLEYWLVSSGVSSVPKTSGKTEKQHLLWEVGTIAPDGGAISDLEVSTDENTGNGNGKKGAGHQEYTEEGTHYLNSGATLKFTASDTGLTCSVSDEGIEIEVVVPVPD